MIRQKGTDMEKFRLPKCLAALTLAAGLTVTNAAVASWGEAHGYAVDGTAFNIYHVSPYETDDPNEFVTEVCYPVRKK